MNALSCIAYFFNNTIQYYGVRTKSILTKIFNNFNLLPRAKALAPFQYLVI